MLLLITKMTMGVPESPAAEVGRTTMIVLLNSKVTGENGTDANFLIFHGLWNAEGE